MILCIEASNIISGGGVTHLVELLRAAEPGQFGFARVIVWASQATLAHLEERPPFLDHRLIEFAFSCVPDNLRATRKGRKKICNRSGRL